MTPDKLDMIELYLYHNGTCIRPCPSCPLHMSPDPDSTYNCELTNLAFKKRLPGQSLRQSKFETAAEILLMNGRAAMLIGKYL